MCHNFYMLGYVFIKEKQMKDKARMQHRHSLPDGPDLSSFVSSQGSSRGKLLHYFQLEEDDEKIEKKEEEKKLKYKSKMRRNQHYIQRNCIGSFDIRFFLLSCF